MNKSLTILFIPDNGERTYEFKLGRSLIGLILSIVSFSVILLGFGLNGIYKVERLQNQITIALIIHIEDFIEIIQLILGFLTIDKIQEIEYYIVTIISIEIL